MLVIDGSHGEGGGQILRSSLALSLMLGVPFRIERIRARRSKPGLLRQHLTAVRAAAAVGSADVEGAVLGSQTLAFHPRAVAGGSYRFDIGSAGSTTLVLQTVLVPLLLASAPSDVEFIGGTHNPHAPPFRFLERTFLPLLSAMGARVHVELVRPGFYPAGGGVLRMRIEPVARLTPIDALERGRQRTACAFAEVAKLPLLIAERELATIEGRTGWPTEHLVAAELTNSISAGNVISIELAYEHVTEVFTAFGERGVRAEDVAADAVEQMQRYVASDAVACEFLTDQLLLPMAIAGGGGFTAQCASLHATTNADVIEQFLERRVRFEQEDKRVRVTV
ncbi:MAG TPA: RNA 3'-terminal phosphate cyclase [Candidatus Limnocylindrales bacterium]|nr:RNA 3'-terminal phosphate cyclase [Candidatus Limnocylindrales bacterium]